jgi:hypothetical protein
MTLGNKNGDIIACGCHTALRIAVQPAAGKFTCHTVCIFSREERQEGDAPTGIRLI